MSQYHAGRTTVPVFTTGTEYFCALRPGERPPAAFGEWHPIGEEYGYRLFSTRLFPTA
jgi:hypothetical protein